MSYDAFVNYKSEDRAWAQRLVQELAPDHLNLFWDRENLVPGPKWEPQLRAALEDSKALIVLWSKRAADLGSWPDAERFLFDRRELKTPLYANKRPVVCVCLDAFPAVLGEMQMVQDILDLGNPDHPADVPDEIWKRIGRKVRAGIRGESEIAVKTIVLAASKGDLTASQMGSARWSQLQTLLSTLGIEQTFADRYGADAWEWRPYGNQSVNEILAQIEDTARREGQREFSFERVDLEIANGPTDAAVQTILKVSRELALILIDPLSLQVLEIDQRLNSLTPCFESRTNAFAVLAPQAINDDPINVLIQAQIQNLYRSFFFPPIPPIDRAPSVGVNVRNARELLRILMLALAGSDSRSRTIPDNEFTRGYGT